MRKLVLVLVVIGLVTALLPAAAQGTAAQGTDEAAVQWLLANAVPFDTAEPRDDDSDLEALRDIIGDARIVALGEATHGTHEFLTMKDRVVRFLVEEMGFTVFAMEARWTQGHAVNAYVQGGPGAAEDVVSDLMYWIWYAEGVIDMVDWMRTYNQQADTLTPVEFYGFDVNFPSEDAAQTVLAFLAEAAPASVGWAEQRYACLLDWEGPDLLPGPACYEAVREVSTVLREQADALQAASSAAAYTFALRNAEIATMAAEYCTAELGEANYLRDEAMADVIGWLIEDAGPDARIVLWAHNAHVMDSNLMMGRYLAERYGEDYVNVGFTFYEGAYNAVSNREYVPLDAAPIHADSFEALFYATGWPRLMLDLRPARTDDPAAAWLAAPRWIRWRGGSEYDFAKISVPDRYDALIYFEHTTPSHLLFEPDN